MKKALGGFMDFVREQGVVGLAVGLVLGGAVATLVKALIDDFVNPLVGIILKSPQGLKSAYFKVAGAKFMYGDFLNTLINFLVIAAVIYFVVHGLRLDRVDRKKESTK
ncbi:MscL family protein [Candidatus Microgenomates bacterium]|nr:MscL family protein [Candidatus Microgenomates bacterium]